MAATYAIALERPARKALEALPRAIQDRVRARLDELARDPRPHHAKRLQGRSGELLRVRVSDYRIIYRVEDARLVVVVLTIGHRREVYR